MHLDLSLQMEGADGRVRMRRPLKTANTTLLPSTDFSQFMIFNANHHDRIFCEDDQPIVSTGMPFEVL